jgi:hypothetical protein
MIVRTETKLNEKKEIINWGTDAELRVFGAVEFRVSNVLNSYEGLRKIGMGGERNG